MPYIKPEERKLLDSWAKLPSTPGELNYLITRGLLGYLRKYGESYTKYNEIIGVLECVKQEFYRKAVAKYEDKKCEENGEVF